MCEPSLLSGVGIPIYMYLSTQLGVAPIEDWATTSGHLARMFLQPRIYIDIWGFYLSSGRQVKRSKRGRNIETALENHRL